MIKFFKKYKKSIYAITLILIITLSFVFPCFAVNTASDRFYKDGKVYSPYSCDVSEGCICSVTPDTYSIGMGDFVDYASWVILSVLPGDLFYVSGVFYGSNIYDHFVFADSGFSKSAILISESSYANYISYDGIGYWITVPTGASHLIINLLSQDFVLYVGSDCPHTNYTFDYYYVSNNQHSQSMSCDDCGSSLGSGLFDCNFVDNVCTLCGNTFVCSHPNITEHCITNNNGTHNYVNICDSCSENWIFSANNDCIFDSGGVCLACGYSSNHGDDNDGDDDGDDDGTIGGDIIPVPDDVFWDGFQAGYNSAYADFLNSSLKNAKYTISITFTDLATGFVLTSDYPIDIVGAPNTDRNYISGDGLLLKDIFETINYVTFDSDGKLKAMVASVYVTLEFDDFISYDDGMFYFTSTKDGVFVDDMLDSTNLFYIGTDDKLYPFDVSYDESTKRYNLNTSGFDYQHPLIKAIKFSCYTFSGENSDLRFNSQYVILWSDQIAVIHNQMSYNQGFVDGEKSTSNLYENDIIPPLLEDEWYEGYDIGYNIGFGDGFEDQNNGALLISSVLDSIVGIFYSMFSFEILGVNLAVFIGGVTTLLIVLFVWRKIR